jgi:hypothetical protein
MNAPRDLRVEDELSGAAAVSIARNAVVIDSGAGPGDSGARGEPKEGGSLVEVMLVDYAVAVCLGRGD